MPHTKLITLEGFTPADLAAYRDKHADEWKRWWEAVCACYGSTGHGSVEVQAAVDQVPVALVSKYVTYSALLGLGAGNPVVRAIVTAKMVEQRLAS